VNPDVLYLWQRPFDLLGAIACVGSRAVCVHAERTDPARVPRGVKTVLKGLLVPRASGVISNSEAGRAYWLERRLPESRVATIPNIVPVDELASVAVAERPAGAIAVGRLDSSKNVLTLVHAIASLKRLGTVIPLSIVGEGPLASTLEDLVADAGLRDHVVLCGYRRDVWSLMKGSSVFVSLSHYEGEPNVVLEAAALGCRLLLSDIPAHRALLPANGAIFVNPDSVEDVAGGLSEALHAGPGGATGASRLVRDRSAAVVAQRHVAFFRQVVAGSGRTSPAR
jgi:glycosyltransferase involved in cell wall biosynthesis